MKQRITFFTVHTDDLKTWVARKSVDICCSSSSCWTVKYRIDSSCFKLKFNCLTTYWKWHKFCFCNENEWRLLFSISTCAVANRPFRSTLFIINGEDEKFNSPIKMKEYWTLKVCARSPYMFWLYFISFHFVCVWSSCIIHCDCLQNNLQTVCILIWQFVFMQPNCIHGEGERVFMCSYILLTYQIRYQFIFMLFIKISISCTCIVSNMIHGTYRVRMTEQLNCIDHKIHLNAQ